MAVASSYGTGDADVLAGGGPNTTTAIGSSYGTYANAFGSVVQAVGQIYSSIQAQQVGAFNEAAARANAQADAYRLEIEAAQQRRLALVAEQEQTIVAEAAAFQEARMREQFARLQGTSMARVGASGLAQSGSPLYVMEENMRQAELEVLTLRYNAQLQQRALREEGTQRIYAATLADYGIGERLRVGAQQGTIARYLGGTQASANLLGASGSFLQASGQAYYGTARSKARDSLLGDA